MKKFSKKQPQHFLHLKHFLAKMTKDGRRFLVLVNKQWLLGSGLILTLLLLLLLSSPGYYSSLNLFWQKPKVKPVKVQVPIFPYPVNKTGKEVPVLSARSVVVMDVDSSVILYQKNPNLLLLPASTTKIMTALIALDFYQLDQILTVGQVGKNGQSIDLLLGEQISVENLLYGLLVASGNDAAVVLAQNFPGGQQAFIAAMNKKAQELNLVNTHFANPTGIDHPNHYSTALDLARLTVYALKNPILARLVATPEITVWDAGQQIAHRLFNINRLVGKNPYVMGVKTGWTEEAGECLIAYVRNDSQGIITVVLGSQNRFGETEGLINWVFENFEWGEVTPSL